MSERKPWTAQEDKRLLELTNDTRFGSGQKLRWGDIAIQLQKIGAKRSGKQCRQRWHNQLKPGIDNDREWSTQQQKILFQEQEEQGNRWALIAKALPGRTDNNIKNYFYSFLRKALRKVNSFVVAHKKEQKYKNVKEFKPQNLSKILTVAESKYEQKINLKSIRVINDAKKIKKMLIQIQLNEKVNPEQENDPNLEEVVQEILQFNRNCKRRKGKKKDDENQQDGSYGNQKSQAQQESNQQEQSMQYRKKQKSKKFSQAKKDKKKPQRLELKPQKKQEKQVPKRKQQQRQSIDFVDQLIVPMNEHNFTEIKKQKSIAESGRIVSDRGIGRSSSSGNNFSSIFDKSSSLNRFPVGAMMPNQISHQYKIQPQNQTKRLNLLDSMPVYESKRAEQENGTILLKQNPPNFQSINFLEQSRGFNPFQQEQVRVSNFLGSFQAKRKIKSRTSRNHDLGQLP